VAVLSDGSCAHRGRRSSLLTVVLSRQLALSSFLLLSAAAVLVYVRDAV